ncbi:nitronate monooxygenase [Pullulanibacillus sp. KACC 23026]|uniref:NAD(P)H-dependent flavin oxidoreductase n=1 Tax=Pullulanibacillus sp. KACC 23026 TaxID=3028315 RepID=UPI0023B192B7|nr:nitronate monooxygenase [Pullulanibacillus sp. KACC 23026]WEG14679.1 nitronate monooxygenase [Pullulanibacillus sp. KACC 23026]
MLRTKLIDLLNSHYPIIQAPMAGGITTSQLVAEVSSCGGLGMIGAGYMTPDQIREQTSEIKQLTSRQFGINLFVPNDLPVSEKNIEWANEKLESICKELKVQHPDRIEVPNYKHLVNQFYEQIKVLIEEKIPICSFTFGLPSEPIIKELKQHSIILIGTATTVSEAIEVENKGMDIVVVQGSEAGGHRGDFLKDTQESLIGLMSLIPQVVDHVKIPIVAAGGIMDRRGLMASLCLGAQGVQMGTAFLTCIESGAHPLHKEAILGTTEDQIVLTRAFSGKWARGIKNRFISEMQEYESSLPAFPVQNSLTKSIRKAAALEGKKDFMSLWSGQSPRLAKNQRVSTLMKSLIDEQSKSFEDLT